MGIGRFAGMLLTIALLVCAGAALAQEDEVNAEAQPSPVNNPTTLGGASDSLTLGMMMTEGGLVLYFIGVMSFVTVVWALYLFLTVTPGREVPPSFVKSALNQLRAGDLRSVYQMCDGRDVLFARVLRAGLKAVGHDRYVLQEAMESEGERAATALWQKISYLNNIGVIAPLLGLLGTVWGMIQAFGAIAMNQAQSKNLAMAAGVSKAMVTTFAGLLLAIPAFLVYYYLRGRVIKIVATVEAHASEVLEVLTRRQEQ
ncbi:MAG TPA: MotA/TolQ/ExbB proton channel family protein [Candidatus Hydrogenedentes bacterium]|nr:MotA/TolQ/ExbB proton channel family protein [Candidatus Hydrogenedentota bacterium]HIJ74433.1 MotA/TolQ/ExbB proton channel family protein [Candidatus Hydrogenedentota bacterium]